MNIIIVSISESRINIILKCLLPPSTEIFDWLLDYPNPAIDTINYLEHGSTVKLVKEPCLPLEITRNYLWLLIPAIINKSITKCNIGLLNLP